MMAHVNVEQIVVVIWGVVVVAIMCLAGAIVPALFVAVFAFLTHQSSVLAGAFDEQVFHYAKLGFLLASWGCAAWGISTLI